MFIPFSHSSVSRKNWLLTLNRAFIPELSGRSLEAVDAIFDLPWYKIGRFGGSVESNTISEAIGHGDDAKAAVTRLEEVVHTEKA